MAMIYSQVPCECAGTFTTNVVKAMRKMGSAGCKERCESTGCDRQFRNCQCMYRCGRIWLLQGHSRCGEAEALGINADGVLIGSTGVIGKRLPIDRIVAGVKALAEKKNDTLANGTEATKSNHDD